MDISKLKKIKISKKTKKSKKTKRSSLKKNIKLLNGGYNKNDDESDDEIYDEDDDDDDKDDVNLMVKSKDEDKKCAPNKKYEDGSCMSLNLLKKLGVAYNKYIDSNKLKKNKINIVDSKRALLVQLNNNLKDECSDQICWTKKKFVNLMDGNDKKELLKFTFKPTGPQGRFTWLNTTNIDDVMKQYENVYSDFKFLGTVPMDFDELPSLGISNLNFDSLYNSNKYKLGIILNTDEHYKSGAHWIALFANLKTFEVYFFDSYGKRPEKRVRNLVKRISLWCYKKQNNSYIEPDDSFMCKNKQNNIERSKNAKILYNKTRKQYKNSECGVYSINFILRLLKGESFDSIISNPNTDEQVNKCREQYFKFN